MENLKLKVITGYDDDQKMTISANEGHLAYYLFLHPEERAIFSNGVAVIGKNIKSIVPDWNATMGWNETHKIDDDDLNEISRTGMGRKMALAITEAKSISYKMRNDKSLGGRKLSEIISSEDTKRLS